METATQLSIYDLTTQAQTIARDVQTAFGSLTSLQLNWKPYPEKWSIGQCLDHLIITNRPFFPIIEQILRGERKNTWWERLPLLPGFFGKMLIKALDPTSTRKIKAPAIFQPSNSSIDTEIVSSFLATQQRLTELMQAIARLELAQIIISSPASKLVTYSLLDAYRIIIVHERRHLVQAQQVRASITFPKA